VKAKKRLPILEEASIDGKRKAIDYGDYDPGKRELFDLESDAGEHNNLLKHYPARAEENFEHIKKHRNRFPTRRTSGPGRAWTESDEDRIRTLRSLGYVE